LTSMLQRKPDVPLLWIQGAAGTGKSILSASIVQFMESAGYLVLSHFSNYAYPSSIKYDLILRSLVLQLVRRDGDLAAYVFENYIVGKKVPSIPILERLLQLLLSSISKEPRHTSYIWIVIDGIDECEALTQNKTRSLISQVTSRASNSDQVICKALVSCRFSTSASASLRKCQSISLTEEKDHISDSIRRYASQRLTAVYSKFQQINLTQDDIKNIEDAITEKSDGSNFPHSRYSAKDQC
jgi:archaellum biogenesis ATPase FlaH